MVLGRVGGALSVSYECCFCVLRFIRQSSIVGGPLIHVIGGPLRACDMFEG